MPQQFCGYGFHWFNDADGAFPTGDYTGYAWQCPPCDELYQQYQARQAEHRAQAEARLAQLHREREQREREQRRRRDQELAEQRVRGRRFGVEIEFKSDEDADILAYVLTEAGVPCCSPGYTHDVLDDQWKIVGDGSLRGGWELVSPPLYWDQREQVHTACEALVAADADIDYQCGLHVHHDVRDLSAKALKRFALTWHGAQSLTDQLVAASRRSTQQNEWCAPFRSVEVRMLSDCDPNHPADLTGLCRDRYRALNLSCYENYGTVEVRQHQGTLNANKIVAWVAYGQALIEWAKRRRTPYSNSRHDTIERLLKRLATGGLLDATHYSYLRARVLELNPHEQTALAV